MEVWERRLQDLFGSEIAANDWPVACDWLVALVRAGTGREIGFQEDLLGAAKELGVDVPMRVHSVRTLGPARRPDLIPSRLRIDWSRAH